MSWKMSATNNRNGHNGNGRGMATDDMLDHENQRLTENLADKVNRLKNIAFDMETDTKDSNQFLNGVHDDFDGSTGLLTGTMKRVNNMVGSGKNNRRLMCYLILGLVIVFVIAYYIVSRLRSG